MKTLLFVVVGLAQVAVAVFTPFTAQAQATKAANKNVVTITIDNFSFNAKTESVAAGSQVTVTQPSPTSERSSAGNTKSLVKCSPELAVPLM